MIFYIVIIPVLLLSVYVIFKLRFIKKHDRVLFRFCQMRREIMSYLRTKNTRIPQKDYNEIRNLLIAVNSTIHNYNDYKKDFFRVKDFVPEAKKIHSTVNKAKRKNNNNAKVEKFYQQYAQAMLLAFLTYSPFLGSKIIIILLISLLSLIAKASGKYLGNKITRSILFLKWLKGESRKINYT